MEITHCLCCGHKIRSSAKVRKRQITYCTPRCKSQNPYTWIPYLFTAAQQNTKLRQCAAVIGVTYKVVRHWVQWINAALVGYDRKLVFTSGVAPKPKPAKVVKPVVEKPLVIAKARKEVIFDTLPTKTVGYKWVPAGRRTYKQVKI